MFVSSNLLKDILPYYKRKLIKIYDERETESIFFLTCFYLYNLSKIQVLNTEKRLTESELLMHRDIVERLQKNEPLQYVLGQTEFYGLKINVTSATLIPRPETEELVDYILKDIGSKNNLTILDIGTGSGCIAIALKKNIPSSKVLALDISNEALEVAKQNATLNNVEINFWIENILESNLKTISDLDVVVSNPPYIPNSDKTSMHKNVLEHEPHSALFVDDTNPLIFYQRIIELGLLKLESGGKIYFEIHPPFSDQIAHLLKKSMFNEVSVLKDLSGMNRFVIAIK